MKKTKTKTKKVVKKTQKIIPKKRAPKKKRDSWKTVREGFIKKLVAAKSEDDIFEFCKDIADVYFVSYIKQMLK